MHAARLHSVQWEPVLDRSGFALHLPGAVLAVAVEAGLVDPSRELTVHATPQPPQPPQPRLPGLPRRRRLVVVHGWPRCEQGPRRATVSRVVTVAELLGLHEAGMARDAAEVADQDLRLCGCIDTRVSHLLGDEFRTQGGPAWQLVDVLAYRPWAAVSSSGAPARATWLTRLGWIRGAAERAHQVPDVLAPPRAALVAGQALGAMRAWLRELDRHVQAHPEYAAEALLDMAPASSQRTGGWRRRGAVAHSATTWDHPGATGCAWEAVTAAEELRWVRMETMSRTLDHARRVSLDYDPSSPRLMLLPTAWLAAHQPFAHEATVYNLDGSVPRAVLARAEELLQQQGVTPHRDPAEVARVAGALLAAEI